MFRVAKGSQYPRRTPQQAALGVRLLIAQRGCTIGPYSDILNEPVSIRKLGTFWLSGHKVVRVVKQVLNSVKPVLKSVKPVLNSVKPVLNSVKQ